MIRSISLENFKSWKQIRDMKFAPITGLFGTNSSGKTSILQWLLMLKQTVESPDRGQVLDFGVATDERDYVELGTFRDVVHNHDENDAISWKITWENLDKKTFNAWGSEERTISTNADMAVACKVVEHSGRLVTSSLRYQWGETEFAYCGLKADNPFSVTVEGGGSSEFFIRPSGKLKLSDESPIENCYRFSQEIKNQSTFGDYLRHIEDKYEHLTRQISYLGPLRSSPRREYRWSGSRPVDVGQRGDRVVDALIASRENRRSNDISDSVEGRVAEWLKELHLIESFEIKLISEAGGLYIVEVRKTPDSPPVLIPDVGFGISQILPVIVLCYYVPKGSIIIFEHPEIHLHPSAQAGLADVFIDAIKTRGIQIILESHSEHLLRRLQRRIAEEKLSKDDVALYFCEYDKDRSKLKPLEVDPYGNIKNWPSEFFGDMMGEVFAMTDAATSRILKDRGR